MKLVEFIASILAVGFWGWLALFIFGGIVASSLLVFPFLGLFLVFAVVFISVWYGNELYEKYIKSKIGKGVTEYPTEISMCLYGSYNENQIDFSEDGKRLVLICKGDYWGTRESEMLLIEAIKDKIYHSGEPGAFDKSILDQLEVISIDVDVEDKTTKFVITIPDELVLSEKYINHEMQHLGRIFKQNYGSNTTRWLLYPQGERKVYRRDGKLIVEVSRKQLVPGFIEDTKLVNMSENQITRNIKNRLWNKVEVKCISINEDTYLGEII